MIYLIPESSKKETSPKAGKARDIKRSAIKPQNILEHE